jgi:hypothetical protein
LDAKVAGRIWDDGRKETAEAEVAEEEDASASACQKGEAQVAAGRTYAHSGGHAYEAACDVRNEEVVAAVVVVEEVALVVAVVRH